MKKEKQIEQMARVTCQMYTPQYDKKCAGVGECDYKCLHYQRCEILYNIGYRKQSEGEWIDLPDNGNGWFQNGQKVFPKHCSICGEVYSYASKYKFCPKCGAKMTGGVEG